MPRPCGICAHPDRVSMESAVQSGASIRGTAKRFAVGHDALRHHLAVHVARAATNVAPSGKSESGQMSDFEGIAGIVQRLEFEAKGATGREFRDIARELRLAYADVVKSGAGSTNDTATASALADQAEELARLVLDVLDPYPDAADALASAIRSRYPPGGPS